MFQVANFEYVEESELAVEEETPLPPPEDKASVNNPERANYWEDLLRDKYEVQKVEEFNAMGKGKRSRKQVCFEILVMFCHETHQLLIIFGNSKFVDKNN